MAESYDPELFAEIARYLHLAKLRGSEKVKAKKDLEKEESDGMVGLADRIVRQHSLRNLPVSPEGRDRNNISYQEARSFLGEKLLGYEEIQKMEELLFKCGVQVRFDFDEDAVVPCGYQDLRLAAELDEMMIFYPSGIIKDNENKKLTLATLSNIFDYIDPSTGLQNFFHLHDNSWFKREAFPYRDQVRGGWGFFTRDTLPSSGKKSWWNQSDDLSEYEQEILKRGASVFPVGRRSASEIAWGCMVSYFARGERLLYDKYDFGATFSDTGSRVLVGTDQAGIRIAKYSQYGNPTEAGYDAGVCPARFVSSR